MYANGLGVDADNREANKWYSQAAQKGNPAAENNLGFAYLKEVVESGLATLVKRLTPDQIARANQSAQEWIARNRLVVNPD
jgi:TPR repeat protein